MIKKFIDLMLCLVFPNQLKRKWENYQDPNLDLKDFSIDELSKFLFKTINVPPANSITELGCHDGKRLAALREYLGNLEIDFKGVDINSSVIEFGKLKYANLKNFELSVADLFDYVDQERFDLVFTYATLMYVHPLKLKPLIRSLIHKSRTLILIEPVSNRLLSTILPRRNLSYTHNYESKIKSIIKDENFQYRVIKMPKGIWSPKYGEPCAFVITNNN